MRSKSKQDPGNKKKEPGNKKHQKMESSVERELPTGLGVSSTTFSETSDLKTGSTVNLVQWNHFFRLSMMTLKEITGLNCLLHDLENKNCPMNPVPFHELQKREIQTLIQKKFAVMAQIDNFRVHLLDP